MLGDDKGDLEVSFTQQKSENDYAEELKRPTVGVTKPGNMRRRDEVLSPADREHIRSNEVRASHGVEDCM